MSSRKYCFQPTKVPHCIIPIYPNPFYHLIIFFTENFNFHLWRPCGSVKPTLVTLYMLYQNLSILSQNTPLTLLWLLIRWLLGGLKERACPSVQLCVVGYEIQVWWDKREVPNGLNTNISEREKNKAAVSGYLLKLTCFYTKTFH